MEYQPAGGYFQSVDKDTLKLVFPGQGVANDAPAVGH